MCIKISIFSARIHRVCCLRLRIASSALTVNGDPFVTHLEFFEQSCCRNFVRLDDEIDRERIIWTRLTIYKSRLVTFSWLSLSWFLFLFLGYKTTKFKYLIAEKIMRSMKQRIYIGLKKKCQNYSNLLKIMRIYEKNYFYHSQYIFQNFLFISEYTDHSFIMHFVLDDLLLNHISFHLFLSCAMLEIKSEINISFEILTRLKFVLITHMWLT